MSEVFLFIIPFDYNIIPEPAAQNDALAFARTRFPEATEFSLLVTDKPDFYDAGQNFASIHCPDTGNYIDMEWWSDAMDKDFDGEGFRMLQHASPCSGREMTLNDLVYDWPQGYARFALCILEPHVDRLTKQDAEHFGRLLGTPVRPVFRAY